MQGLPRDLPVMQVYARIQRVFPGGAGPAVVVVSARDVTRPQVTAGVAALKRAALASGRMHEPITVGASTSRRAARVMTPWTERAPTRPPTARSTRCAAR